jgi:lysophospholipase L1-like esterase
VTDVTGTPARPTVALLGDSITDQSERDLRAALDAYEVVAVVARPGHTFEDMQADTAVLALDAPDIVVVNLGTNDALKSVDTSRSLAALDATMAAFRRSTVLAVTVAHRFGGSEFDRRAGAINDRLRAGPAAIVAWDEIVALDDADRRSREGDDHDGQDGIVAIEGLLVDGLHPSHRGRLRLARAVAETLAAARPA